jgi:hypothetical protein
MFPVVSIQRVKELIEGAGKQREVWEVFVPQASGFDETPTRFNEIKVGGIGWKIKELHVERLSFPEPIGFADNGYCPSPA